MATRVRESALGKDKKGTTSNPLHDKPAQRTRRVSLSRTKDPNGKHDPPPSEKHVPNYPKKTLSSTPGASKNPIKKQISVEVSRRPHLTRTTSSDKAPLLPSPHTPKTPNPNHPLRSSSLSAKTSAVLKPVVDKSSKSPRGGEKHRPLYGRSLSTSKKSETSSKNHDVGHVESTKKEHDLGPPERVITTDIPEVPQIEEVNDEPEEVTINAVESHKDEELVEHSRVLENQDKSSEMQKTNETNVNTNASLTDSPKVVAEEKEGEGSKLSEKREEVTIVDERERVHPERAKEHEVVNEVKQEAESSASQVKKNSAVSNDVIEETASKLREQRKNKVKALAGAFETVITLQDPK